MNGANFLPGPLAPNMAASLFGTRLSWDTKAIGLDDITGGEMPIQLAGVHVVVAGYAAHVYYVSPNQINFLVPSYLRPGVVDVWVARDGMAGNVVEVTLAPAAPALFQTLDAHPLATHLNGSLITAGAPAAPGEIVVLYATGLGCINSGDNDGTLPSGPEWLCDMDQFSVQLAGSTVDHKLILYAGVAPGYAGLYQINLRLPQQLPHNPELRIAVGEAVSAAGVILPTK